MKSCFYSKLFDINYRIAIHPGNAKERLAREARPILGKLSMCEDIVPDEYQKEFKELEKLLEDTLSTLPADGLTPTRLRKIKKDRISSIHNATASKYIKLLLDIQYDRE